MQKQVTISAKLEKVHKGLCESRVSAVISFNFFQEMNNNTPNKEPQIVEPGVFSREGGRFSLSALCGQCFLLTL